MLASNSEPHRASTISAGSAWCGAVTTARRGPRRFAPGDAGRLRYRLLTGPDDSEFCARISAALDEGYELYSSPAATFNGDHVIVAVAVAIRT